MQTVRDIIREYPYRLVLCATLPVKAADRKIAYSGPGWYSMDDNETYQPGEFSTFSRIKLEIL